MLRIDCIDLSTSTNGRNGRECNEAILGFSVLLCHPLQSLLWLILRWRWLRVSYVKQIKWNLFSLLFSNLFTSYAIHNYLSFYLMLLCHQLSHPLHPLRRRWLGFFHLVQVKELMSIQFFIQYCCYYAHRCCYYTHILYSYCVWSPPLITCFFFFCGLKFEGLNFWIWMHSMFYRRIKPVFACWTNTQAVLSLVFKFSSGVIC